MSTSDPYYHPPPTDTDCMTRQCLGNIRPFNIRISNMQGQQVMGLNRDCNCQGCCCPCCLQEMYVEYPPGQRIAIVREKYVLGPYTGSQNLFICISLFGGLFGGSVFVFFLRWILLWSLQWKNFCCIDFKRTELNYMFKLSLMDGLPECVCILQT